MRVKRNSHGGEHWTPRKPDANGRREVVEIDLRLGVKKQEIPKSGQTGKPTQLINSTEPKRTNPTQRPPL